jgi:hypothetical protein
MGNYGLDETREPLLINNAPDVTVKSKP